MPWSSTIIYFADERVVPLTDDDSNYKLVAQTLLAGRDGTGVKVVKLAEGLAPPAAAADYEEKLKGMDMADGVPVFGMSAGRGEVVEVRRAVGVRGNDWRWQPRCAMFGGAGQGRVWASCCATDARCIRGMVSNCRSGLRGLPVIVLSVPRCLFSLFFVGCSSSDDHRHDPVGHGARRPHGVALSWTPTGM